jgi:hypothetical protein
MKDKIKEILVDVYQIDGRLEDEAAERILRLFSGSLPLTDGKLSELKKMAENYCYLTHDDKPTISQKGLALIILEATKP